MYMSAQAVKFWVKLKTQNSKRIQRTGMAWQGCNFYSSLVLINCFLTRTNLRERKG